MKNIILFLSVTFYLAACSASSVNPPQNLPLSATEIMQRAHQAAGGPNWVKPESLVMTGYGIFYEGDKAVINDRHQMWRIYPAIKNDAHQADGKVRIDSFRGEQRIFQLSFDGTTTYNHNGPLEDQADSDRWQANFGFGVVRFALEPGYELRRVADDLVDGSPVYNVMVIDPEQGETLFSISQQDYAILRVGFNTPRGWHERLYSDFFSKPGIAWSQPGRVRLFYNGVKANEIIWTDFTVNEKIDPRLFVLP